MDLNSLGLGWTENLNFIESKPYKKGRAKESERRTLLLQKRNDVTSRRAPTAALSTFIRHCPYA